MMRFVDIRNQGIGYRFAFWDTTIDKFVKIDGSEAFDSLEDLRGHCVDARKLELFDRLKPLCEEWVADGKEDDVEGWYEGKYDAT